MGEVVDIPTVHFMYVKGRYHSHSTERFVPQTATVKMTQGRESERMLREINPCLSCTGTC